MTRKSPEAEEYPEVPEKYRKYIGNPYGGLFGNAVQVQIVEKLVADPDRTYRPRDFKDDLDVSYNSIKKALSELTELKLLIDISREKNRPEFKVNTASKQLWALTFLAYAVLDDRDGTDLMNQNIREYCQKVLPPRSSEAVEVRADYIPESTANQLSEVLNDTLKKAYSQGMALCRTHSK